MSEKILVPKKISIKNKPYGRNDQLFISVEAENTLQIPISFKTFVTKELCMIILEFLKQQKVMRCIFENENLICVTNRCPESKTLIRQSENLAPFDGIPVGATFYSTHYQDTLYCYVKVCDLTLTGYVSMSWVEQVVRAIAEKEFLIFQIKEDKKGRPDFRNILQGRIPPAIACNKTLPHVAYYGQ